MITLVKCVVLVQLEQITGPITPAKGDHRNRQLRRYDRVGGSDTKHSLFFNPTEI